MNRWWLALAVVLIGCSPPRSQPRGDKGGGTGGEGTAGIGGEASSQQAFVLQLLREQHVLVVQGSGFNWPRPDHLRIVTLPRADDLTEAIGRIGTFLDGYRPG